MQQSEQLDKLAGALAKAQGAFKALERNREVEVKKDGKKLYSFAYTTLDAIVESIRGPLSENDLSYVQGVDGSANGNVVETMLIHSSGQWLKTIIPIDITRGNAQATGSAITYAKRYALAAMLGIVSEDDDDGNGADGNTVTTRVERPQSNRSADNPNWRGPKNKSDLKRALSSFANDVRGVEDAGSLTHLIETDRALLEQCAADLPEWWIHDRTQGVKPLLFETAERVGAKINKLVDEIEKASEKPPIKLVQPTKSA